MFAGNSVEQKSVNNLERSNFTYRIRLREQSRANVIFSIIVETNSKWPFV